MGVRFVAKGVNGEPTAREYAAPVRRGLEAIHFLNESLAKCERNFAPDKVKGTQVGDPVPQAAFLSCKGTVNCIETSMSESESMTMFVIARTAADGSVVAERPMFIGNYQGKHVDGGNAFGVSIYLSALNRITGTAGFGADAAANENKLAGITKAAVANLWGLYMFQVSPVAVTLRDFTANLTQVTSASTPRRMATGKIRVGSGQSNLLGSCDIALFQGHSVLLTEQEIQATVADLRAYALRRGIQV